MNSTHKLKILNDPIYGFITIPNELIFDVIQHPYFQRLRRVSQMGLTYLVYPGAHHTRFHHALGCMHLMNKAIQVLRFKKIAISEEEATALLLAILLHDIGHGPFSHAMEHSIVEGITHEEISLAFMEELNKKFNGKLSLAIQIFKGDYPRNFFNQLISSQLDMDRADYLKRDSFYTGVAEGNINSERLITMLNVVNDELVVEEKGIYSIEKFLLARRLMYWQVYLHKTSLVAEQLLVRVLKRAKELTQKNIDLDASKPFKYFLNHQINDTNFTLEQLKTFALLDDYDIMAAMKSWMSHEDVVLSNLCKMIINRDLLKISISSKSISKEDFNKLKEVTKKKYDLEDYEVEYFVFKSSVSNQAYDSDKTAINLLMKNGDVIDVTDASDHLNLKTLAKPVKKYFVCYPKEL
ncbi:HD domain-containing protein [Pseudofulvibacter geojedonensis]|uniref:HD domain-containing protein n=1 Tax=Pseudofulvibacter geojedonensis TaxID=1123758 RepID=A0ABW3HYH6_9FLAO